MVVKQDIDARLVADVARDIVSEVAPDELAMFEVSTEAYLADPRRAAAPETDEMLGFGGGGAFELLTPVVLTIASGVISFLVDSALSAAKTEGRAIVQQRVRQLFKRFSAESTPASGTPPAALTPAQLAQARQVALDIALRMHVPPDQAALLADAAVGQLVLAR